MTEAKPEPWSPVSICVDAIEDGVYVLGIYALSADSCHIFYAKHHPVPKRKWVGLTEKDILEAAVKSQEGISPRSDTLRFAVAIEAKLKEKNA